MNKLEKTIFEAANAGGMVLQHYYETKLPEIKFKADKSLVTTADLESEAAIISVIRKAFPNHGIGTEEQGELMARQGSQYKWLVDALDGTENFVSGIPYFSISIAVIFKGLPRFGLIYNPISEELYFAKQGKGAWLNQRPIHVSNVATLKESRVLIIPDINTKKSPETINLRKNLYAETRRMLDTWSPALDWCLVASGRSDALITVSSNDISSNAGTLILEEAGGLITDFSGKPCDRGGYLLASNRTRLHGELLRTITNSFETS